MKKLLLVYPPFCSPSIPPYSLTNLYSFLKANGVEVEVLDLNLEFHKLKFPSYYEYYKKKDWKDYDLKTSEYSKLSSKTYSLNNNLVVEGEKPELFAEMIVLIKEKDYDFIAFSIVYSSQAFYAYSLIEELKDVIIGGPAVNSKLKEITKVLKNEVELLEHVSNSKINHDSLNFTKVLDFSIYSDYFTPSLVIPLKTSSTCCYKQCTFCSHFSDIHYFEYPLEDIRETIIKSKAKYFFVLDDMISRKRLLDLAAMFFSLNVKWTCQLKPTVDLDILDILKKSGLSMIIWGVESGCNRILKLMKKNTNVKDISLVLKKSSLVGIKNVVNIIFGFPTETHLEFLETVDFLKKNQSYIDLISTSVFGLQKGTKIYENPSKFGITKIIEEKRTMLEPKISYLVSSGLTQKEANKLRKNFKKTFENINKFPKTMNFFREHMLISIK